MTEISRRSAVKLLSAGAASAVLTGCGLSSGSAVPLAVAPGSITPKPGLRGVRLVVGSKEFTEQLVLAYIAEFALVAAGANVRDMSNITGSSSSRNALVNGQIDMAWEYTGTSWINYHGMSKPIPDPVRQYEAVRKLDQQRSGISWIALTFRVDNTYALAVNQDVARRLDVSKLSDLQRVPEDQATFCIESEFANRSDGFPGMLEAYGLSVDQAQTRILNTGTIYQATAMGKACNFGEVYTTDGRVRALNLTLLEDDRKFFPRYNLGMTMRTETLRRYPELVGVFEPVAAKLSNAALLELNAEVDVDGRDPADVARDWMVRQGFVEYPGRGS